MVSMSRTQLKVAEGDDLFSLEGYTVAWADAGRTLQITGPKGQHYVGFMDRDGHLTCNCPSYVHSLLQHKTCKHIPCFAKFLETVWVPPKSVNRHSHKLWHDTHGDPARVAYRNIREASRKAKHEVETRRKATLEDLFPDD
jgi:hypothetical protein